MSLSLPAHHQARFLKREYGGKKEISPFFWGVAHTCFPSFPLICLAHVPTTGSRLAEVSVQWGNTGCNKLPERMPKGLDGKYGNIELWQRCKSVWCCKRERIYFEGPQLACNLRRPFT